MANILDVLKVIDKDGTEYTYNPGGLKCEVQKYRGNNQDRTFTKEGAVAYVSETAKFYASGDKMVVVGGLDCYPTFISRWRRLPLPLLRLLVASHATFVRR